MLNEQEFSLVNIREKIGGIKWNQLPKKKLDEIENRSLEIQNENIIKAARNFLMVVTNQESRLRELEQKIETITSFITPEDRFNLKKAIDFKVYESINKIQKPH